MITAQQRIDAQKAIEEANAVSARATATVNEQKDRQAEWAKSNATMANVPVATDPNARYSRTNPNGSLYSSGEVDQARSELTSVTPFDENAARQSEIARQQGLLTAIEDVYNRKREDEINVGRKDLARSNTVSAITGMAGAPEATTRAGNADRRTKERLDIVNEQKALAVAQIYGKIDENVRREKEIALATNRENAANLLAEVQQEAGAAIAGFAAQDIAWDDLMKTDPQTMNDLIRQSGRDPFELKKEYELSRAATSQAIQGFSTKIENGQMIATWFDPNTGKPEYQQWDLGLPVEEAEKYSKSWFDPDTGTIVGLDPVTGETIAKKVTGGKPTANNSVNTGFQTSLLSPEQSDRLNQLGLAPHQQSLVGGIMNGTSPPINPNNPRTVELQKTLGGLAELGYDNTKAFQDWTSMQKRLQSMNSVSQLRLAQAISALDGSVMQARRLYEDWEATGLPTGFSTANYAALQASARLPGEAGVAARTLISHVEDMSNELAVIYRGGNSPTDMALESAQRSLSADWNPAQFAKNLELIEQNLRIRQNSIATSAQVEGNIYAPEPGTTRDIFGGNVMMLGPDGNQYEVPEDQVEAFIADGGSRL